MSMGYQNWALKKGIFAQHSASTTGDFVFLTDDGHKSSKTKEIYTHVSNKDVGKIKSQLDNLQMRGGEDD